MAGKGSQFEREICKTLSRWWTQDIENPRDDVFWRTSQSGGRATERMKKGKTTAYSYGDVTMVDPIGQPFIDSCLLELKRGYSKDISVLDFVDRGKGKPLLLKWWDKATKEKHKAGRKYVLIILRRNARMPCVLISTAFLTDVEFMFGTIKHNVIQINTRDVSLAVVDLKTFLKTTHPDFFRREL